MISEDAISLIPAEELRKSIGIRGLASERVPEHPHSSQHMRIYVGRMNYFCTDAQTHIYI